MRVLVHDYSGHPFQVELSAELARRGHVVTHSYCAAYVSGRGALDGDFPGLTVAPIGVGRVVAKQHFARRLMQELSFGVEIVIQARRFRPEVVLVSNAPVPTALVVALYLLFARVPWVLWHQDIQGVAIKSFAGVKLPVAFRGLAGVIELAERWAARRAVAVVVIADSFVAVHRAWGTADKVNVIPNWAPLDDIVPVDRHNSWSGQHDLDQTATLLYSGTLGLKHRPELLVLLSERLRADGCAVRLVVVNEGAAVAVLRDEAARRDLPITLLPFQPFERLSEVLGSGDVLVVLLDESAGAFSVPSKTLSYLCAGRPILGLMPAENSAAVLIKESGGCVLPPSESSIADAAGWVSGVLGDRQRADDLGRGARALAERAFALPVCVDRFERILSRACGGKRPS